MNGLNRLVYTVEEVAILLGISRSSAYKLAKRKVFPVLILGKRMVIPKEKFECWLREN